MDYKRKLPGYIVLLCGFLLLPSCSTPENRRLNLCVIGSEKYNLSQAAELSGIGLVCALNNTGDHASREMLEEMALRLGMDKTSIPPGSLALVRVNVKLKNYRSNNYSAEIYSLNDAISIESGVLLNTVLHAADTAGAEANACPLAYISGFLLHGRRNIYRIHTVADHRPAMP